jgi:predicted aspartyl protease
MHSYTGDYDNRNYDPAAPVVEIGVAKPGSQKPSVHLVALIDSGADATMLPINALQTANARYVATRQMRTAGGHTVVVETYLVTLFVGPFLFPGIEAIAAAERGEVILGRDALNHMVVTLNGLANVVEMSQ